MIRERRPFSIVEAQVLAIQAAGFLSGREDLFRRFLTLTGISLDDLRDRLGEPAVLAAILDFIMYDDQLLLSFAAERNIDPALIGTARRLLPA